MLRNLPAFVVLLASAAIVQAGTPLPKSFERGYPPEMPEAEAVTYKKAGDVELKLYVFKPNDHRPTDRRPAIIFFFGGGWTGGSPAQFRYQCQYLASRGMVAMAADYRVASRHQVKAIDCVRDAVGALRYVRAEAPRLGVDPQKIVAAGGSAGGHLAACVGLIDGLDDGTGRNGDVSYRPSALVLFNPALMFGDKPGIALTSEKTGVDPREISPFHHVKGGAPPTLLMFGTADSMIDAARAFADAMRKAGIRCELDTHDDLPHGFFNVGRYENKPFLATLATTDRFLASLGYLQGEPTVEEYFKTK